MLGNDRLTACKAILADDWSHLLRSLPCTIDHLSSPRSWHLTKCLSRFLDHTLTLPLTANPASAQPAESLYDEVKSVRRWHPRLWDVVLMHCSVRNSCRSLRHSLSGLYATQPIVPACCKIARGYATNTYVARRLGKILPSAFIHNNISLDAFHLGCESSGSDPSGYGRRLVVKLNAKLRARKSPNCCQGGSDTMGSVKVPSQRSLIELASLYGFFLRSVLD